MNCDNLIKADIKKNCEEPLTQGVERTAWIVNKSHVDYGTIEFKSSNEISNLPIPGAKAYEVIQSGEKPFDGTNSAIEVGAQGGSVTHQIKIYVPNTGPEVCRDIVDPMLDGSFVMIQENRFKNLRSTDNAGGAAFQVYGFHNGLSLTEGSRPIYDDSGLGGWIITLTESKAPKSGMYLNAGTYAATKTLIKTLVAGGKE